MVERFAMCVAVGAVSLAAACGGEISSEDPCANGESTCASTSNSTSGSATETLPPNAQPAATIQPQPEQTSPSPSNTEPSPSQAVPTPETHDDNTLGAAPEPFAEADMNDSTSPEGPQQTPEDAMTPVSSEQEQNVEPGEPVTSPAVASAFDQCRFHFGAIDQFARNNPQIAAELDYFTPGWMGIRDSFDQGYVCDDTRPGGALEGKVPVVVAYVAAFHAKRHANLNDCNVADPDLCQYGSAHIKQNLQAILGVYDNYARGYADCYGTERPIIFQMEPDYYQYTYSEQTDPMSPSEAGQIMSQFVDAIRQHLPNAFFSLDISPWVAPNNGEDGGAQWFENFDMSLFTFVNTSGGGTDASSEAIRASNNMTWAGVHQASGKPILADTGYGVNGRSAGHDEVWDNPQNINARIADGVVGIAQYNPDNGWGSTIASIRGQLDSPGGCP